MSNYREAVEQQKWFNRADVMNPKTNHMSVSMIQAHCELACDEDLPKGVQNIYDSVVNMCESVSKVYDYIYQAMEENKDNEEAYEVLERVMSFIDGEICL